MPIDNTNMQFKKIWYFEDISLCFDYEIIWNQDILLCVISAVQVYATNMFVFYCVYIDNA